MENYFNYFTEIEERYLQRRGGGLLLSTLDWSLIETWKDAGIPLEAVLRGIDAAFDRYDQRPAKTKKINSLAYCSQEVLAAADDMVIGEEAFIDRDTRVDFQRSGTYHVLVVSGMNVSILAFVSFWVFRRMRLNEWIATIATVSLCVAYASITDVGPPVWRATLMCSLYLATRLLYRDRAMVLVGPLPFDG